MKAATVRGLLVIQLMKRDSKGHEYGWGLANGKAAKLVETVLH
jgi:hypothetical protein